MDTLVYQYDTCLTEILDKHAPKKTFTAKEKKQPWYTKEIHSKRREKRYLQRQFKKDRSDKNLSNLIQCRNELKDLINNTKISYNSRIISEVSHDKSALFKKVKTLLHKNDALQLPSSVTASEFSNDLNNFFVEKIEKIRNEFSDTQRNCFDFDENIIESTLSTFRPLDEEHVRTMIKKCPNKSCSLDPVLTSLLKSCIDNLVPTVTIIINRSLQEGKMPKGLKHSIITPRIKKPNLPFEAKSFRPVANLSLISKLIEQAVIDQLNEHFV